MTENVLEYVKLLQENNITEANLPTSIRKQINGLKLIDSRYKSKPTPAVKESFDKQNVVVADAVADFLEKDYEEEESAEDKAAAEQAEAAKQQAEADAAAKAKVEQAEQAEAARKQAEAEAAAKAAAEQEELVLKIRSNLTAGNTIRQETLKNILGKKPNEPVHEIGSLKLKRVPFTYDYKVI